MHPSLHTILARTASRREVRVRSHGVAQALTGFLAVVVGAATVVWLWRAWTLRGECGGDAHCAQPADFLAQLQFGVACAGLVTGSAMAAYLGRFALAGRIWRRSRGLAATHAFLICLWLVIWVVGALTV